MNSDISLWLSTIIPAAERWAAEQEALILQNGVPLSSKSLEDAHLVGVKSPEKIRLLKVEKVPIPDDPQLQEGIRVTNLVTPHTIGMALRYGIYIRSDCWGDRRLIAHECVHTAQYERLGSIGAFLKQYLTECLEIGYPEAPMEQEAVRGALLIQRNNWFTRGGDYG